jgi:hypothetical protein
LFEKFKKQIDRHNPNTVGESACVDHVAGTSYSVHFNKTIEKKDYSYQLLLKVSEIGMKRFIQVCKSQRKHVLISNPLPNSCIKRGQRTKSVVQCFEGLIRRLGC